MPDPVFITVPKGSKASPCRGRTCGAAIYWVEGPKMRKGQPVPGQIARTPVHCDVEGGSTPDDLSDGSGVNHFTDCPDAGEF